MIASGACCAKRRMQRMNVQTPKAESAVFEGREEASSDGRPLVSIVDDDQSVRESLPDLLIQLGFDARTFPSARAFLDSDSIERTKCLLLDIAMPGMSGLDLQRELRRRGHAIPIVFITARGDKGIRRHVLQHGAVECLFKPFGDVALLEALRKAMES